MTKLTDIDTAPKPKIDLAMLDATDKAETGRELKLEHPDTGELLGISIILRGSESDTFRRALRAQVNKRMRQKQNKTTMEEIEAESVEMLAACTVSWSGIVLDGKEYTYSRANAVNLYIRFGWIKRAVDAFVNDEANFRRD